MAKMIPTEITFFKEESNEQTLFEALKNLSDDYYVFHSYRVSQMASDCLSEYEADFLIFNPLYGCLVIEAKAGHIYREDDGQWYYQNGSPMKNPFDQACSSMYAIKEKLTKIYDGQGKIKTYIKKCKFLWATWFHGLTRQEVQDANFGPNAVKELILTKESIKNVVNDIESIMKRIQKMHLVYKDPEIIVDANGYQHQLTKEESLDLFANALCPSFDIVPSMYKQIDQEKYNKLLKEQCTVLDFLAEQKSAAVSGASGTGKTFVALERARRIVLTGEKVLFLCYNNNLKNELDKKHKIENVDFYTIDGYACKKCKTITANYYQLKQVVENEILEEKYEYKHIIVDEGQDFGIQEIEESHFLDLLADYGTNGKDTSFFIFYDKNQLVNGASNLPSYLQNVDSKISLYHNCRNTKKIGETAYSLIDRKPIPYPRAIEGESPRFFFYSSQEELEKRLDNLIEKLSSETNYERVILTCKGMDSHSLTSGIDKHNPDTYISLSKKRTKLYTTNTFKGLESDNVILIDVDKSSFDLNNNSFYVGASRARKMLYVFISMNDNEILDVLQKRFPSSFKIPNNRKRLSLAMHALYSDN